VGCCIVECLPHLGGVVVGRLERWGAGVEYHFQEI